MTIDPTVNLDSLRDLRGLANLRHLSDTRLDELADSIRTFLIKNVCATGGHLGSNLGVVELTIALHRVFDSPAEPILFDTGHQAYVHKIVTGRSDRFRSLRRDGGLSGYPNRSESVHDWIENSHASTALSYADGLSKARHIAGDEAPVVAVVGDGAMTGGMAWEALNNIGTAGLPVIIVLNDNGRSYSPTVGSFSDHLTDLRAEDGLVDKACGNLFTSLGCAYLGPTDGHDIAALEVVFCTARVMRKPVVVHVVTTKGEGFEPALSDEADRLHAVGVVDPRDARPVAPPRPSWTAVFGEELLRFGHERQDVVAVTAAMRGPTGLDAFAAAFPDRFFDVGIAEQHAVASAAGMAMGGLRPVVALYSTFLSRAFDQVLMDVALHRLPVTFVVDRAGVTGPDGPSHHGMWDASLLSLVPGLQLAAPRDATQLRLLFREAVACVNGPTAVRLPKAAVGVDVPAVREEGTVDVLLESGSRDVLLISYGAMATTCLESAKTLQDQDIGVTVVDPRWACPVTDDLLDIIRAHRLVITVEDNERTGGLGSRVTQSCRDRMILPPVFNLGLPCGFLDQGTRGDVLAAAGLSAGEIARQVLRAREGSCLGTYRQEGHDER
ncbi:1-deoxy-D-xylulose-5-phosphate synthase [Rhodococcus erythropolis]|uniref:1-deoxy-D-xylulose-5-phosphate synthase n=1 Tax=Rhodococcus erythropolis TaxID=1833 RepID=UPI00294A5F0A|nr:1-deoxy-D-xylulose-5-phosphate synthase [Rhodococcus erythropolis]MDV6278307.1 1-deoxy-D-xylulose-5-phosphate synthase [Rhodococcus erythropolis]